MEKRKTVQELQTEVDEYISQFKEGYFSPLAMLARMTEELGELAREVNHYHGEKPKKDSEDENTVEAIAAFCLIIIPRFFPNVKPFLRKNHLFLEHRQKNCRYYKRFMG